MKEETGNNQAANLASLNPEPGKQAANFVGGVADALRGNTAHPASLDNFTKDRAEGGLSLDDMNGSMDTDTVEGLTEPAKAGRPSEFSPEIADKICERLADGESLRKICSAEDMPGKSTVFRWLADEANGTFRDQYARAREAQADALFEDCLDIADDSKGDTREVDGKEIVDHEAIARAKLRVDTRKWMAGKLRPKVYGDKITQEMTGEGGGPVKTVSRIEIVGVPAPLTHKPEVEPEGQASA